jgi:hypothetical protein
LIQFEFQNGSEIIIDPDKKTVHYT